MLFHFSLPLHKLFPSPTLTCWTPTHPSMSGSNMPSFGKSFLSLPSRHLAALLLHPKHWFESHVQHFSCSLKTVYSTCLSVPQPAELVTLSCHSPRSRIRASGCGQSVSRTLLFLFLQKQTLLWSPGEFGKLSKSRWRELVLKKLVLLDKIFS